MADVDMTDAPTAAPASTSVVKKKGAAGVADGDSKGDGKKRFEVKKVSVPVLSAGGLPRCLLMVSSGTLSRFGHGISWLTTAPFAATTSWIYVCARAVGIVLLRAPADYTIYRH
jgi:hypothetical protein